MISMQDALDYLHIDYADDAIKANVQRAMNGARARFRGAIGDAAEQVFALDGRADELILIYTAEGYDLRADQAAGKVGSARAHLIVDYETQLRLEYRRRLEACEEGGGAG